MIMAPYSTTVWKRVFGTLSLSLSLSIFLAFEWCFYCRWFWFRSLSLSLYLWLSYSISIINHAAAIHHFVGRRQWEAKQINGTESTG